MRDVGTLEVVDRPSPNHGERAVGVVVDILVIHYTGMADGASALEWLCRPSSRVSAHYLVEENGSVFHLVPEHRRAWHAGASSWRGHDDVNSRSIGIELVNPGHEFGYRAFPEPQIAALIALCHGILERHPIPPRNVVGHADVAPARKSDPGELFPWRRLAAEGIGLWPSPTDPQATDAVALLRAYGYTDREATPEELTTAFQRHFRPNRIDGVVDRDTLSRLSGLVELVARERQPP